MVTLTVTNPTPGIDTGNALLDPSSLPPVQGPNTQVGDVPGQMTPATVLTEAPNMSVATMSPAAASNTVVTSQNARDAADAASQYLQNQTAAATANAAASRAAAQTAAPMEQQADPADNFKLISSIAADLTDAKVSKKALRDLSDAERSQKIYQANMKKVQGQLDQLQKNMEARTAAQVEDIKAEYASLMDEQRLSNEAYQRGVFTAGLVSGREMYAPEIQSGIMANAVNYGIKQLTEIQRKRSQLINEAYAAQDEMNFRLLTEKMNQIRQTYIDERDTTLALKQEMRTASEYERNMYEYQGTNLAPYVVQALSGNAEEDDAVFLEMARKAKMPEAVLRRAVDDYQREQEASLPASIREYNYLRENGMLPPGVTSYTSYQNYGKGSSTKTGKAITMQEAARAGLRSLAGVDLNNFIEVTTNMNGEWLEEPPAEFAALVVENSARGQSLTEDAIKSEWERFKKTEGADKLRTGYNKTGSDLDSKIDELVKGLEGD